MFIRWAPSHMYTHTTHPHILISIHMSTPYMFFIPIIHLLFIFHAPCNNAFSWELLLIPLKHNSFCTNPPTVSHFTQRKTLTGTHKTLFSLHTDHSVPHYPFWSPLYPTLVFVFLKCPRHVLVSGPLPVTLFSQIFTNFLLFFRSLLKCHLLSDSIPDKLI